MEWKSNQISILFILIVGLVLTGCKDKTVEKVTYMANVPIYMDHEVAKASIMSQPERVMENPGKIYFYQNYIFINERFAGVHIINNTNPAFPEKIGFINIPANIDIAVKGNMLYADSYRDLLTIDISDLENVKVVDRKENVFQMVLPPTDNNLPVVHVNPEQGIVIGWEEKEITETKEVGGSTQFVLEDCEACDISFDDNSDAAWLSNSGSEAANGTGGSMARFTLVGDHMYTVHGSEIKSFDVSDVSSPQVLGSIDVAREVETIFPAKDHYLFIGTTTGMLIYDIAVPGTPEFVSQFDHARNCDPVVVDGDYAYVTLRTGSACGGNQNQLDVVNIENLNNPYLVRSYELSHPYGLGVDNGLLFVCDGYDGLKIFSLKDIYNVTKNKIAHFEDIKAFDVIPMNNVLLMIGDDGFYQYDYADAQNIQLLSSIRKGE